MTRIERDELKRLAGNVIERTEKLARCQCNVWDKQRAEDDLVEFTSAYRVIGLLAENSRMRELLTETIGPLQVCKRFGLKHDVESFLAEHP